MIKPMIRKSILTAAAVLLVLTLPGCGSSAPEKTSGTSEPAVVTTAESTSEQTATSEEESATEPAAASTEESTSKPEASTQESATETTAESMDESASESYAAPDESTPETASAASESSSEEAAAFPVSIRKINKHGNVVLDISFEEMDSHNIAPGDIITVSVGDTSFDIPTGTSYSDVDTGQMVCRFDLEDKEVGLGINMGSFAEKAGIAKKQKIEEDPGYKWDVKVNEIKLALKEKEGYLDEYTARQLVRSNERGDYPQLTDEEYANFRAVKAGGIKENWLYRSSTPLEAAIGRNEYAMAAMEKAGVRSVVNLDDPAEKMKAYDTYPGSYYSRCPAVNPEMSYDYTSEAFSEKIKQGILFMIENDGPYLIHCKEGKDRTGIFCAILECFAGASPEEVKEDYMLTYSNYYDVKPGSSSYDILLRSLVKPLGGLFGTEGIDTPDLKDKAREYLLSTGLTDEQLESLENKLR